MSSKAQKMPPAGRAEEVFHYLAQLVEELKSRKAHRQCDNYSAYLHGQVYGAALVLRLLYPGPGNWGEKAALLVRPVITEHQCDCEETSISPGM